MYGPYNQDYNSTLFSSIMDGNEIVIIYFEPYNSLLNGDFIIESIQSIDTYPYYQQDISINIQNNKIKGKPLINSIGLPDYSDEGIPILDLIQERLSKMLSSNKVDKSLKNRIKNVVTKEINYIWGKKPFVEVIIHYN